MHGRLRQGWPDTGLHDLVQPLEWAVCRWVSGVADVAPPARVTAITWGSGRSDSASPAGLGHGRWTGAAEAWTWTRPLTP